MADDQQFLGRGWAFPVSFGNQGRNVAMAESEEDIRQSLSILFSTRPGERIMVPDYGCNLQDYLFETVDETTEAPPKPAVP